MKKTWLLVADLLGLVQLICAPRLHEELLEQIQVYVEKRLKYFRRAFKDFRLAPKFHYMIHYRHWATRLGLLRKKHGQSALK